MSTPDSSATPDVTRTRPLGAISPQTLPEGQGCRELPRPGWVLFFTADDHHSGNCTMIRTGLYVYADGSFFFTSSVSTTGSGDVWIIKNMHFNDKTGGQVGDTVPQFDGPNMEAFQVLCFNKTGTIPNLSPADVSRIVSCGWTNHC